MSVLLTRRRAMMQMAGGAPVPPIPTDHNTFIDLSKKTLTAGYINDSGGVSPFADSYFLDEFYPLKGMTLLSGTSDAGTLNFIGVGTLAGTLTYRIAYYDANKQFLSRTYKRSGATPIASNVANAVYIKVGWSGTNAVPTYIMLADAIDSALFSYNGFIDASGNFVADGSARTTDYRDVDFCNVFALPPYSGDGATSRIAFYDATKAFISRALYGNGYAARTFTDSVPQGAAYYRLTRWSTGGNYFDAVFVEG